MPSPEREGDSRSLPAAIIRILPSPSPRASTPGLAFPQPRAPRAPCKIRAPCPS